jgi:hypothetical protein
MLGLSSFGAEASDQIAGDPRRVAAICAMLSQTAIVRTMHHFVASTTNRLSPNAIRLALKSAPAKALHDICA